MTVVSPTAKAQFIDAAGIPLAGGFVYTYAAGTTTPQATYTDSTGATANSNPIVLDSRGEANIWLGSATYKFKLTDANGTEIWTVDNISAPTSSLSPVLSGNVTIDTSSSGSALTISQSGTGAVIKVPDTTNPTTTLFTVDNTGHVGIGTASPANALDVAGGTIQISSAGGTSYATLGADASNTTLTSVGARGLILNANSTNLIYGTSSGYVGVKNASPTVELDVTGAFKTSGAITGGTSIAAGTTLASGTTLTAGSSLNVTTSASIGTTLSVDTVQEKTSSAGVSVNNTLKVDTISGKTSANTVTLAGISIASSQIPAANRLITSTSVSASTSGIYVDFSGFPSWVRRITIIGKDVSYSGAATNLLVQIGPSTTPTAAGYTAVAATVYGTNSCDAYSSTSAGFPMMTVSAAISSDFIMTICHLNTSTNTYVASHNIRASGSATGFGSGSVDLTGSVGIVRVTTTGGNTFDNGEITVFYE